MEFYIPRKLMFKGWNKESRLLMRLDSIKCVRGELAKDDHIILQYTGRMDKQQEDLYEMDVVLIGSGKHVIRWSEERNGWCYVPASGNGEEQAFTEESAKTMIRLCSYFESSRE